MHPRTGLARVFLLAGAHHSDGIIPALLPNASDPYPTSTGLVNICPVSGEGHISLAEQHSTPPGRGSRPRRRLSFVSAVHATANSCHLKPLTKIPRRLNLRGRTLLDALHLERNTVHCHPSRSGHYTLTSHMHLFADEH